MAIRPIVIDINHNDGSREIERHGKTVHEDLIDWHKLRAAGFLGCVHKATEGEHFIDPLYAVRKPKAIAAGLLWAAYHFMRPGDVGNQVSHFLSVAQAPTFTRFALDYEDEKLGLWQADRWLELIHTVTKQRAWLYGGGVLKEQLAREHRPSLAQYQLWLAEYGPNERIPAPWTIDDVVLWQRSGDGIGPGMHDVPGVGRKQDIDYFDGTDEELKEAWNDLGPGVTKGVVA
jgi:GH25 family lysozyme M1 (1,4-beta-N-acetylmuramidase)